MERNIGEIFEYNGEWYQCLGQYTGCPECALCAFKGKSCDNIINLRGECISYYRSDRKDVHFKKLEKVGEPIEYNGSFYQGYKAMETAIDVCKFCIFSEISCGEAVVCDKGVFYIKIKQNKENMEERETLLPKEDNPLTRIVHAYVNGKISDKELIQTIKGMPDEYPYNKFTPFDLKAAKAGKPVCTRDGRKARIVCFDAEGNRPLIVLSKINGQEVILRYTEKGRSDNFHSPTPREDDLMMLPEKKEGWINIYNADTTFYYVDGRVFETKDEAVKEAKEEVEKEQREKNEYIDTIRVEWEE